MNIYAGLTVKTLLSAIQRKCLDCCGGNRKEVVLCEARECPLYNYRIAVEASQEKLPGTSN